MVAPTVKAHPALWRITNGASSEVNGQGNYYHNMTRLDALQAHGVLNPDVNVVSLQDYSKNAPWRQELDKDTGEAEIETYQKTHPDTHPGYWVRVF